MAEMRSPTFTVVDDVVTAAVAGEFDMAATLTLEPLLERALETPELRLFRLDLSRLTFIDSVGLGVVLRLADELEARSIPMRVVRGPRQVHRIFESMGMADALPFEPDGAASVQPQAERADGDR